VFLTAALIDAVAVALAGAWAAVLVVFLVCVLFCVVCEQWDSTHVKLPCSLHNHLGAVFGKWYVMTAARRSQPAAFCFVGTLNCVYFVVW
jgi:hypothetical protein